MKNKPGTITSIITLCCLILSVCSACTPEESQPVSPAERDSLYQLSTLNALMAGNYDGIETAADVLQKGDFGIGTFDGLDGEMVMLDGRIYQVKDTGEVITTDDTVTFPFLAVTYFDEDMTQTATDIENYDALKAALDSMIDQKDRFYAIKVSGTFTKVQVRSVPRQEKPYPVLSEVTEHQPVFDFEDVEGTLVGFWCPDYIGSVNVPGYHLHLISNDRTKGGHLLDVQISNADIVLDETTAFEMTLAEDTTQAGAIDNAQEEIEKVEK